MGTSVGGDRKGNGVIGSSRPGHPRQARLALRLAASGLLVGAGCINVLGDVDVDAVRTGIQPIQQGADQDCPDAGLSGAPCVVSCSPGTSRCSANLLQRCNDLGNGWNLIDQCGSAALCDGVALSCAPPVCAASEYRCTADGALQVCRADRTDFELVRQCTSAAYCSAMPGRELCTDAPCRAGRERCNGPQIEKCREDRSGYDVVGEPCASAALCVEGEADQVLCAPPTCVPGTFSCDGARLSRCSDDANRYIVIDECSSAAQCSAEQQRCVETACAVGAQRCAGNVLQRCNAEQSDYTPAEVCASAALCDATAAHCLMAPPVVVVPPDPAPDPSVLDGASYDFVDATSSAVLGLGPMRLRVPTQWSDVDRGPWTNAAGAAIGPRFVASTDAARFTRNFDIPGVYFAATEAAPVDVVARQQEFDMSSRCSASTSEPYDDDLYTGTTKTWTNCGVTKATLSVVVAVDKLSAHYVTVVIVGITAARDQDARNRIWSSFVAD